MPKTISTNWLLFLVLISSFVVAACGGGGEPEEVTVDLRIADRALVGFDSAPEIKQDDVVYLQRNFSDEAASFHLHGYDHELELSPPRSPMQLAIHRRRHRQLSHDRPRGGGIRR